MSLALGGTSDALLIVGAFAAVGVIATLLSTRGGATGLLAEGAAFAGLAGLSAHSTGQIPVAALAVVPFVAGIRRGLPGALETLVLQAVIIGAILISEPASMTTVILADAGVGLFLGLGLGLIAVFVRATLRSRDELSPYQDARELLQELLGLSDVLHAGLDPQSIGARVLSSFQDAMPAIQASLWVRTSVGLQPVTTGSLLEAAGHADRTADDAPEVLHSALLSHEPVIRANTFAVPLSTVAGRTLAVEGEFSPTLVLGRRGLVQRLQAAAAQLSTLAAQLDTALVFTEVNVAATRNERRRLAREMHDGVAQDIASMGYLVDAIADGPLPDDVRPQVELLRGTITRVVAEVRASVTALRMDVDGNQSLGEAISGLARRLSDASGLSIRCTIDERTARLRPEVEAELLRIAQEAMTNAVKHASASEIDVECLVDAPRARIVVKDNGRGLGPARADSHGLTIMRERADLIGASLSLDSSALGTVVYVSLGSRRPARTQPDGGRS
ncbi:MAG TPA: histidine kinase [Nocardioides sp.]